jgi:hypothetical protein
MSEQWKSAKPLDKRGVNKANMDQPQEEFVGDALAGSDENGSAPTPAGQRPEPVKKQENQGS